MAPSLEEMEIMRVVFLEKTSSVPGALKSPSFVSKPVAVLDSIKCLGTTF